ncbi:MAG: efflux RND transporter permease subunit, partial [Acidiphilium sp.]|nr:efflux RND transporter permease subunit [Acidiphilium sp.]
KSAAVLQKEIQEQVDDNVAGQQVVAFQPPSLPGSQGLPVQFVIKTTEPFGALNTVSKKVLAAALKTGKFIFLQSDLKIDQPQSTVVIDRAKAATLGLTMSQVGAALTQALGGLYVNYFSLDDRSYEVIPQVSQSNRLNSSQLLDYPITSVNGVPIPLSAVAHITNQVIPESVNHFQQLNSATIQGVAAPGVSQGETVTVLDRIAKKLLPPTGYDVDYGGPMRQFVEEQSGFLGTFGFAVVVIFLALAALFNSFRDPLIILVSVPMSIAGALIFIYLGFGLSLNIYTEVGLVTLMGLISKHGILIVEVANEAQIAGMTKREAIEHAVGIRLRPILMTTSAMVLGVVPLIIATGAGAAARYNMGMVIATGLAIGTLFTLFVLPAVYLLIGQRHVRAADVQGPVTTGIGT